LADEKKNTDSIFTVAGFSFSGQGQNTGIGFVHLKSWDERKGEQNHAPAIAARVTGALSRVRDAQVFALVLPAVPELGITSGFDLELEDPAISDMTDSSPRKTSCFSVQATIRCSRRGGRTDCRTRRNCTPTSTEPWQTPVS